MLFPFFLFDLQGATPQDLSNRDSQIIQLNAAALYRHRAAADRRGNRRAREANIAKDMEKGSAAALPFCVREFMKAK